MLITSIFEMAEGPARTAALAHWVQAAFSDRQEVPVLVGGAAIELYTGGAYTTGDLDFVGSVPRQVVRALTRAGFVVHGRHWIHEEGRVFLEFPSRNLDVGEQARRIEVHGHSIRIISLEDLLLDRLVAWEHWKSAVDGVNAFLLLRARRPQINFDRLESRAVAVGSRPAVDALLEFGRQWAGEQGPSADALQAWATNGP